RAAGGEASGADDAERRFHMHLAEAGQAAAAELAGWLTATSLLDLGAGAGAYSRAFLLARPSGRATLVDTAAVLGLAAAWLGPLAARARLVAGDASVVAAEAGHDAALLANVLHLHPPEMCARLCAAAAHAVAPGGVVMIKDLRVDEDRRGPIEGLLFALNMAIYTEAGDVYPPSQLRAWLADAGLVDLEERRLMAAPDAIVVLGRRPGGALQGASARSRDETGEARADPRAGAAALGLEPSEEARDVAGEACAASRGGGAGLASGSAGAEDRRGSAEAAFEEEVARELDAALARTAEDAWRELVAAGAARPDAGAPALAFPAALRRFLARAVALERREASGGVAGRADPLVRHYTEAMPRMRVAQLAGTAEPGQALFHTRLDWERLPRLAAAIDRLFAALATAGVDAIGPLGAASAGAFRAQRPTLAALYERTHYGGFMPLLYGFPADLAYFRATGTAGGLDTLAIIDRYLTAPIVHELCHFARGRDAPWPPHLDECVAGWLGVHVHPELAYPADDHDDALYAAPWLAQVGQAIARAFGVDRLVRAHAAGDGAALPEAFIAAAQALGWDDWRARRTLHFLSDTFDPAPWVALALWVGAGHSPAGHTLASLAATPLAELALPDDSAFDRAIVEDGLRAMCLASAQVAGSFRTRARLPGGPIAIDPVACAVFAPRRGALDPVPPRYWLPPAVAARIAARHPGALELHLGSIAAIPDAAAAICEAPAAVERDGFALRPR
ncbi:MAG TPA: methyltransferase, partial [Kofleriaceae bacterium]|nr:methyltransferase [Kofleriaceae bacterium]